MTPDSDVWRDFHLDHNCITLSGEDKVRVYLSQIRRALTGLSRSLQRETSITNAERHAVDAFVTRLRATFEALALRHFFAEGDDLKIDGSDSGFVHFSALIELAADLESRDAKLAQMSTPRELKRRMLDQIVDHGVHPRALQVELMRRLYLESLGADKLFRAFLPGKLERVGNPDDSESYFWSFSTYDRAMNRPFVYLLYFGWEGGEALVEDSGAFAQIRGAAESSAGGRMNLLAFSNLLDQKIERMRPRIVKRLLLGPYWAPQFTQTEGALGELLESLAERLPFAMRWETETLISERETRVGAGWLSKGRLRQVFWIPKDLDLSSRGVSQVDRYLVAPDWLAQQVEAAGVLPDHRCLAIEEEAA